MQGKHLYEYAVIRLVPRVEREEFFNVGIILFSKRAKYIKALYKVDENKLNLFSSELDRESLFANLHVFDKICSGTKEGGPIAALDVPEQILSKTCRLANNDSRSNSEENRFNLFSSTL